jgi:hypothetical protein
MLSSLSVREVRAIILVNGQAQPALERADVVFEEVGIFIEIDGLKSQLSQPFASIRIRS